MRLHSERVPDTQDRRLGHCHLAGHRARAPVRRLGRHRLERARDHCSIDRGIIDRIQRPLAGRNEQAIEPLGHKTAASSRRPAACTGTGMVKNALQWVQ